jgi:outer membrane receptor protein involved in Fe transport
VDRLELSASLEHAWGTHTLRAEYQHNGRDQDGLGAGGLDLPERGYRENRTERLFRLSATGMVAGRLANQARLQLRWEDFGWTPRSEAPAVQVSGAFTSGGAGLTGASRAAELELADDLDWSAGSHAFRAGLLLEAADHRSARVVNGNGTYVFPSLDAYEQGRPILFTLRDTAGDVSFDEWRLGLYVQDDIRIGERLSLNAGVRQERHSFVPDGFSLAPRAGLTWAASSTVTVRAGGGSF